MVDTSTYDNEEELDDLDSFLGDPSAQKIWRVLVCWDSLAVRDIVTKTSIDEARVHSTIKNLERLGIVDKISEDHYRISTDSFALSLKQAYLVKITEVVGRALHDLTKNIDRLPFEEVKSKYQLLIEQWKPVLEAKYKNKLSSLAEAMVDLAVNTQGAA